MKLGVKLVSRPTMWMISVTDIWISVLIIYFLSDPGVSGHLVAKFATNANGGQFEMVDYSGLSEVRH